MAGAEEREATVKRHVITIIVPVEDYGEISDYKDAAQHAVRELMRRRGHTGEPTVTTGTVQEQEQS